MTATRKTAPVDQAVIDREIASLAQELREIDARLAITCASDYAGDADVMRLLRAKYGNPVRIKLLEQKRTVTPPPPPEFAEYFRGRRCDDQGRRQGQQPPPRS